MICHLGSGRNAHQSDDITLCAADANSSLSNKDADVAFYFSLSINPRLTMAFGLFIAWIYSQHTFTGIIPLTAHESDQLLLICDIHREYNDDGGG